MWISICFISFAKFLATSAPILVINLFQPRRLKFVQETVARDTEFEKLFIHLYDYHRQRKTDQHASRPLILDIKDVTGLK